MFCTTCKRTCEEHCLESLLSLPGHNWDNLLYPHDGNLWLAPYDWHFRFAGVTKLARYMEACDKDDAQGMVHNLVDPDKILIWTRNQLEDVGGRRHAKSN